MSTLITANPVEERHLAMGSWLLTAKSRALIGHDGDHGVTRLPELFKPLNSVP